MHAYQQRHLNDVKGLGFIHKFGWLRSAEIGKLMWPHNASGRQAADRLVRGWIQRRLVIARDLPDAAGRALVLSAQGARLLNAEGLDASTGKDIGRIGNQGEWLPPFTWRHDLIATGLLCELHKRGFEIVPEAELKRRTSAAAKIPDGLALKGDQALWIEAERARKGSVELRKMAEALSGAASGTLAAVAGIKATAAMVGFVPSSRDERGFAVDHQARVRTALQAVGRGDVPIHWAACHLLGTAGVGHVEFSREIIPADRAVAVLKRLDASGWALEPDGSLSASYANHRAFVWEEDGQWSFAIETMGAEPVTGGYAENVSAAKRATASVLARL